MKKLLIIVLALFVTTSNAQCILIDLKLSDCVSCRENISILNGLSEKIPVYAVFDENLKRDYDDLEYKLSLKKSGVKYVFSSIMLKKYHKNNNESNWILLNHIGEVVISGTLKELDEIDLADNIEMLLSKRSRCYNCHTDFNVDKIFEFSHDLNKLSIIDKQNLDVITTIRSRDFDFNFLQRSLKGTDSINFVKAGGLLNVKSKGGFKPKFAYFDVTSNNKIYLMLEYIQPFIRNDTISYDIRKAVCKYSLNGELEDVFIVNAESEAVHDNLYSIITLIDDYSFVTVTHDPKNWFDAQLKKTPNKKIEFVTKYTIDTNVKEVAPVNFYSYDLPEVYKKKYYENYLSSELTAYPFISFIYSDEVFNLDDGCKCNILDSDIYWKNVDTTSRRMGAEKYTVLGLQTMGKGRSVVFYSIDNTVYFNTYSKCSLEKRCTIGELYKNDVVRMCYADVFSKQILFRFEKNKAISIPFEVYGL